MFNIQHLCSPSFLLFSEIKKKNLLTKIPDIKKALEAVELLISKKNAKESINTQFELADHLYAHGVIEEPNTVCLWLGANVMVEYPLEEAKDVLTNNYTVANKNLEQVATDLKFLKAQITTTEVNHIAILDFAKPGTGMHAIQVGNLHLFKVLA